MLSAAADLIEEYGWVQGKYGDEEIGFCAMGAVYMYVAAAGNATDDGSVAVNRLAVSLGYNSVAYWNDNIAQSKEEVITALRKAARA
jgi:hypothetical protein